MATFSRQDNSSAGVVIANPLYENVTLLAAGAVTWAAGTVLGRITASGKMTSYVAGAGDGSEVPIAVLRDEQVFSGAGDVAGNVIVAGRVRLAKLIAHGVGAITTGERDELRDYGIVAETTSQLGELDN
tara:strand:- start:974 stop:1360 length:387 start_codon:yes stop_codon:yes gene_type:complete